jgi:hypothetical protein
MATGCTCSKSVRWMSPFSNILIVVLLSALAWILLIALSYLIYKLI